MHQAKGLEWDAVFVCNLVEGRFPALARSQYALFDRAAFGEAPTDEAARARRSARGGTAPLLRRADARTAMLTATEEAREESGRSLSRFYLEAQPFLGESRERSEPVSAAEALAALRRRAAAPAGATTSRRRTRIRCCRLPGSGRRRRAWRRTRTARWFFFGSLVEIGGTRTTSMRLGGAFHDVLEAFHDPAAGAADPRAAARACARAVVRGRQAPRHGMEQRRVLELLRTYFASEVAVSTARCSRSSKYFRFELDATTLTGYIDRIDRLPDGVCA